MGLAGLARPLLPGVPPEATAMGDRHDKHPEGQVRDLGTDPNLDRSRRGFLKGLSVLVEREIDYH